MKTFNRLLLFIVLLPLASVSFAGALSTIYTCVNQETPALQDLTFTFTSKNPHCMYSPADGTTWTVNILANTTGLYCSPGRHSESKASSWGSYCASDPSYFFMHMLGKVKQTGNQIANGSGKFHFNAPPFGTDIVNLEDSTSNLSLCGDKGVCGAQTKVTWSHGDTQGLYLIYDAAG